MPKKEDKINLKLLFKKILEKSLLSVIPIIAEETEHLAQWIKNISGIGKKIRSLMTIIILFTAGIGILGIGISHFLSEKFSNLSVGESHIIVGLFVILIAAIYSKSNE